MANKETFPFSSVHLVGIGGVSMSALGEVLHNRGLHVTGSDWKANHATDRCQALGIEIWIGEDASRVKHAEAVIRTAAAKDNNPEVSYAREHGIPVLERAQAWGFIMKEYKNALCVAGTHGKTTVTSMCAHIAMAAQADPTVMLGGFLPLLGGGHRVGNGDLIILESCEYCNSFLNFFPTIAIILNVEEDHLDFFGNYDDVLSSFQRFIALLPETGYSLINADDKGSLQAVEGLQRNIQRFGFFEKNGIHPENISISHGCYSFDIYKGTEFFTRVELSVPGRHNVTNALAAAGAAIVLGFPPRAVTEGLKSFNGAGRRLEFKGSFYGIPVFDDYAHHPTEIDATLAAVREMGYERVLCVFQPHTYTRTKTLFEEFVSVLSKADCLYLAEIYAAREQNTLGISSQDLANRLEGCVFEADFQKLSQLVCSQARRGDVIITMGAGNIDQVGELILQGSGRDSVRTDPAL